DDFDEAWLDEMRGIAAVLQPAWMCGDAGMWHFGRRDRGHMVLLPPVLTADAAKAMAAGIVPLREATGFEVFPENPPGPVGERDPAAACLEGFARIARAL